jgi:HK97 family phage prohead protease
MTKHWKPGEAPKRGVEIRCDLAFATEQMDVVEPGYIAGIASTPSVDLYGHRVLAGAFDRSIRKKGLGGPSGVQLLADHDWDKPAGVIRKLETVGDKLRIEAQLALDASYVKDLYAVAKLNGGMNFSVGFTLEEFDYIENDAEGGNLIIKSGDLIEVSVVTFPAQPEARMDFIKQHETMSELEKALVAKEFCQSRGDAHRLAKYLKSNEHLFLDRSPPSAGSVNATHPLLDVVPQLKACGDQIARVKAVLRA